MPAQQFISHHCATPIPHVWFFAHPSLTFPASKISAFLATWSFKSQSIWVPVSPLAEQEGIISRELQIFKTMRIDHLRIHNFKGCKDREFDFPRSLDSSASGSFHVLIGENGSGKSTALDALAVALGIWHVASPSAGWRSIEPEEARLIRVEEGDQIRFDPSPSPGVSVRGEIDGFSIATNLAVEHIQPKDDERYPELEGSWDNYLLGCVNCNSTKSRITPICGGGSSQIAFRAHQRTVLTRRRPQPAHGQLTILPMGARSSVFRFWSGI